MIKLGSKRDELSFIIEDEHDNQLINWGPAHFGVDTNFGTICLGCSNPGFVSIVLEPIEEKTKTKEESSVNSRERNLLISTITLGVFASILLGLLTVFIVLWGKLKKDYKSLLFEKSSSVKEGNGGVTAEVVQNIEN